MKRILCIISILTLLALSACTGFNREDEEVPIPFSYTGTLQEIISDDIGCTITIETDGILTAVKMDDSYVFDPSLSAGMIVTISGESTESTGELGNTVTVNSVPLDIEIGYDAPAILGFEDQHLYQSIQSYIELSYETIENGRIIEHSINNSYLVQQDEDTIYKNVVGTTILSGVTTNWSELEYIDVQTKDHYKLSNYTSWVHDSVSDSETLRLKLSMDPSCVTIDEFKHEGSSIVINGTCEVTSGHYLEILLDKVFPNKSYNSVNRTINFTSKYDYNTLDFQYADFVFNFDESVETADGSSSIDNCRITISNVDSNNTGDVSIPDYVIKGEVPNQQVTSGDGSETVDPSSPISDEPFTSNKLCFILFGLTEDETTLEYIAANIAPNSSESVQHALQAMLTQYDLVELTKARDNMSTVSADQAEAIRLLLYYAEGMI